MDNIYQVIADGIADTVQKKNADYGNAFEKSIDKYGNVVFAIRLEDKLNRFISLAVNGNKQNVSDESVIDTVKDIAGYSLLMLEMLQRNVGDNNGSVKGD